jgi:hypothetical protein
MLMLRNTLQFNLALVLVPIRSGNCSHRPTSTRALSLQKEERQYRSHDKYSQRHGTYPDARFCTRG